MVFYLSTTKWKYGKMCFGTIHLYSCVCKFVTVLYMILTHIPIFDWPVLYNLSDQEHNFYVLGQRYIFKITLIDLCIIFLVDVWIAICVSYPVVPGSSTFVINIKRNCFSVVFRTPTTYCASPRYLMSGSIVILCEYANIDSEYIEVTHLYCSFSTG